MFHAKRCGGKVISVGNITTGGTGKTPVTLMIAQWLKSRNTSFAVVSRGYRSPVEKSGLVFNSTSNPADEIAGDEISLLARKLPNTWFGIGRDRFRSIKTLQSDYQIGVFVLDDGFQHWQLHRDLDIVLVDAVNPFGNGWPLPSGNLREPVSALKRADIVIITRTESVTVDALAALRIRIREHVATDRIFETRTVLSVIRDLDLGRPIDMSTLKSQKCIAFCGIGNPLGFVRLLTANGIDVNRSITFDDHHRYTRDDIAALREMLADGSADMLLTTEKDAVKLPSDAFDTGKCGVVEITIAFADREDIFWHKIAEVLAC
jgi:tetraacyldisaccharide 4'-kinase